MDVRISRSTVSGKAHGPPSKSYSHRAILAAGYADEATVRFPLISADTRATMRAVEAYGGDIDMPDVGVSKDGTNDPVLEVEGFDGHPETPDRVIDCANSGTTMRLVTATAALQDGLTVLTGDDSLRSRPQGPLLEAIEDLGGRAESTRDNGQAPIVVGGPIDGGTVAIPGDVSSQYISALLMAGAVTERGIEIELETDLKSAPYVRITLELLADFGVEAIETDDGYLVDGGQTYQPEEGYYWVPGDFSSISYLLAAGVLASDDGLSVFNADPSAQGDSVIVEILERMGGTIDWNREGGIIDVERSPLSGVTVDVEDTPDLTPTIATLGAAADGTTRITNAEHVRYKETDRLATMASELTALGASVEEHPDELVVHGDESDLRGATVDGHGDHRVVMALAIAGLVADGTTTIRGAEHVQASFPNFFHLLEHIGAAVEQESSE
jgi:3-phosphoshikimate 1-carboxyvinyltransferase